MDDRNDPSSPSNLSWNRWVSRPGYMGGVRVPPPPGPRRKPSKAERELDRRAEVGARRAEARAERLHLAGMTNAGVVIMSVVLGAVVVMLVVVLVGHH
jgi:hypothetical protein